MAQYSHFRRTGTNLKTAGVSPQVAWYGIATMSVTDPSRSEKNYYARRSSHHMLEASWLNTSGKRRCSLKRCMHCTHDCHALESVSFSSSIPLPLATSLAPRHVPRTLPRPSLLATSLAPRYFPRTSPPHSRNATSTSERRTSPRAQTPPPRPPLPPSPSPCITVRARRRRMLQPETQTSCSQSCRTSTWPEAATAEES